MAKTTTKVTSRGCSRMFILFVLVRALDYVERTITDGQRVGYPFPAAVVLDWLVKAKTDCAQSSPDEPILNFLGGCTLFSWHDSSSHWTTPQQFFTWWKNNVERVQKLTQLLLEAALYYVYFPPDRATGTLREWREGPALPSHPLQLASADELVLLQRAYFCKAAVALSLCIKRHFYSQPQKFLNRYLPLCYLRLDGADSSGTTTTADSSPGVRDSSSSNSNSTHGLGASSPTTDDGDDDDVGNFAANAWGGCSSPNTSPATLMSDLALLATGRGRKRKVDASVAIDISSHPMSPTAPPASIPAHVYRDIFEIPSLVRSLPGFATGPGRLLSAMASLATERERKGSVAQASKQLLKRHRNCGDPTVVQGWSHDTGTDQILAAIRGCNKHISVLHAAQQCSVSDNATPSAHRSSGAAMQAAATSVDPASRSMRTSPIAALFAEQYCQRAGQKALPSDK